MIKLIPRSKLEPHPDNPRKELGDLSELAASIRKQGLLQNLTVVPHPEKPDMYRIVIGHRRFSASGIAGLDELPCVVDEKMTYPEQIAVMMSENMQRNDLTITERVGGIQMMMDLGMDVNEISSNTGMSDTTVRRYAKLRKLNRWEMAEAEQQGATLMQFAEIAEIEDEAMRQKALENAGTDDYRHTMNMIRSRIRAAEQIPLIREKLDEFATEIIKEDFNKYSWVTSIWCSNKDALNDVAGIKVKKNTSYAYLVKDINITVYEERPAVDDAKEQAKREAADRMKKRASHEAEIANGFKELRNAYMETLSLKGREEAAKRFVLWVLTQSNYLSVALVNGLFDRFFLADRENKPESYTGSIVVTAEDIADVPEKKLLLGLVLVAYDRISRSECNMLDRYTGKPKDSERSTFLNELYAHLAALGYPISTEEHAWLGGTHECFTYNGDQQEGEG